MGKSFRSHADFFNSELKQGHFLGQIIPSIHPDLQAKLTATEHALTAQGYSAPAGSIYIIGGGSPTSGGHRWGLAVDINYPSNPYVMHEAGEKLIDQELTDVYLVIATYLHKDNYNSVIVDNIMRGIPDGFASVSDAYTQLDAESKMMIKYFSGLDDDSQIAALLPSPTPANVEAARWQMRDRYLKLGGILDGKSLPAPAGSPATADRPFDKKGMNENAYRRDPKKGFLDIPQPIVEALCNQGLIWGAIGFGPQSGDIMHFDLRSGIFFSQLAQARRNAKASPG
jgi:hypothetical protein